MSSQIQYSKYYIPLTEEDTDFGLSAPPKGLAKFEIKDTLCNLNLNIENLRPCKPDYDYKCYLVYSGVNKFIALCIGTIQFENGKGILNISFPKSNINTSLLNLDMVNIIVIACTPADISSDKDIFFPLAGYKDEKIIWKNKLRENILSTEEDKTSKSIEDSSSIDDSNKPSENQNDNQINPHPETNDFYVSYSLDMPDNYLNEKSSFNPLNNLPKDTASAIPFSDLDFTNNYEYFNPEEVINASFNTEHAVEKIKKLENMLSMSFPQCKPFNTENASAKWWKIKSMQLLKRILCASGYENLILLNNYLNTSYYIYGYYIIGIEINAGLYHFIYGAPALYGIDPKLGSLPCEWKSESGSGELYGEFGYWLVKFDM